MSKIQKRILVLFIIATIFVTFTSKYGILLKEFETDAHEKEIQIGRYIELSRNFIDLMTIYGNEYFEQNKNINSELYSLLEYDPLKDSFDLDAVAGTNYQNKVGNLTGTGNIPQKGINRDEMNLALRYNEFFSNFHERLEGVEWLYYTSENDFINLYPWVPSKEFAFVEDIKSMDFYRLIDPENNPRRKALWTPVYRDRAGGTMVVTLSSPIYNGGNFMGVISLDISTGKLSELIDTKFESYLVDVRNSIIAADSKIKPGDKPINFDTVFKENHSSKDEPPGAEKSMIRMAGGYYVHSIGFDRVPWRLYFIVPIALIFYKAALGTLPVLIIGVLLLFSVTEVQKVKRTELLLQNSLEELKSYQAIIESAAENDILTNTFNRRGLKESFNKRVNRESINKPPISFVIGDIDYFKKFNDTHGHAAGDKVLVELANILRKSIASEDILCRWGGEEFVIVFYNRSYEEALAATEIIRKEIEELAIEWENSMVLRGTMTFGVAEYNYIDSIDECVSKADAALYLGKKNGRNQVNGYGNNNTI